MDILSSADVALRPPLGIYIHWPFCVRRCSYCAFVSSVDAEQQQPYYRAVINEIRSAGRLYASLVDTIFIGGGTPSSADDGMIDGVLNEVCRAFHVASNPEISIEANPDSISAASLDEWRRAGVNRLSIGLQAAQPAHLFRLGRVHTVADFERAYELARARGFRNINIDLMYGLPYQTMNEWKQTLRFVRDLGPEHVSCYALSLEPGTSLYESVEDGRYESPGETLEAKMYTQASHVLGAAGYEHYEISNFAIPDYECRHNVKYWVLDDYLGIGAAAHSLIGLLRFANTNSVNEYTREYETGGLHYAESEFVTPQERESEFLMLRTRLREGFTTAEYKAEFGREFADAHAAGIRRSVAEGLLEVRGDRIMPTPKGFLFQNRLALNLMTD